ncbi:GAF and ANTAR domain-containing protein [Streptomyces sp. NPDC059224]|uniref:GAF and ANTAR domain-containing protein n=1 Tax=Streptomyces sp. NPDC059224 TaxID=3346775 RepID=UPI00367F5084
MTEYPNAPVPPPADAAEEQRIVAERNTRLARAGVARAEELLLKYYRLSSHEESFELLRDASQRFNLKLHTLAAGVVRLPAPEPTALRWVAGRPHGAPPPVPALHLDGTRPQSRGAVLDAALQRTLRITGTRMGNVQLVENRLLRMVRHTGLDQRFTDYFAFVDSGTTSCAQAAEEARQVTVKDVRSCDTFDERSRQVILQAGSRACHSVPLVSPKGAVVGMISAHHEQPLHELTTVQLAALERLGCEVGRWLLWHHNTVVVDALNQLHVRAAHRH